MVLIGRGRLVVTLVTALLSIAVLEPGDTAAASCSGKSHNMFLSAGSVAPGTGSPATSYRFTVTYADNAGCSPDRIVVVVDGVGEFPLSWAGGDLTTGAGFAHSLNLPTGTHSYRFEAASGTGAGQTTFTLTNVDPAVVVVAPPTPAPTPPPTPRPRPMPTPAPPPTLSPTQAPPAPTPTPPSATASTPAESPSSLAASPSASAPSSRIEGPAEGSAGGPLVVAPSISPPPGAGQGAGSAVASVPTTFDLNGLPPPWLELGVAGVGTIAGLGLFMVLGGWLLGSSPNGGFRHALAAGPRTRRQTQSLELAGPPAPTTDDTAPSIAGADQVWSGSIVRAPILFSAAPPPGVDRCRVVSRLVPLRSEPDELSRAQPLRLDVGDEVDVLRQDGPYCFVRTAAGSEGWVPGLTLAGVAGPARPGAPDDEQ